MTAIRPLLALYFPRLLESTHPPRRDIKSIKENELSDQSPSAVSAASREGSSAQKSSTTCFSAYGSGDERDVEKGIAEDEKGQESKSSRKLEFTDFSKYAS